MSQIKDFAKDARLLARALRIRENSINWRATPEIQLIVTAMRSAVEKGNAAAHARGVREGIEKLLRGCVRYSRRAPIWDEVVLGFKDEVAALAFHEAVTVALAPEPQEEKHDG